VNALPADAKYSLPVTDPGVPMVTLVVEAFDAKRLVVDAVPNAARVVVAAAVNVFPNDALFAESCVVDANDAKKLVVEAVPNAARVAVAAVKFAFTPVKLVMNADVSVAPFAERLVVDALVIHELSE
jgi:hypothetical protein